MAIALLRPCARPHCDQLVESGYCPAHRRDREQQRGTSAERGYGARWRRLRGWFLHRLNHLAVEDGSSVGAICGGRLPGAPVTDHSRCLAEGRSNNRDLEVDHIQPHKGDRRLLLDPLNLQVLCASCHAAKTATNDGGFGR